MSKQSFLLLLLLIFITELAVMGMFEPLFTNLSPLSAGMADSSLLVLMFAAPLWILCTHFSAKDSREPAGRSLRLERIRLFFKLLAIVSIIEFLAMLILLTFLPGLKGGGLALVDASLTTLFFLPFARSVLSRYGHQFHSPALADLLGSPVMIYSAMLYMVFLADAIQETMQPYLMPKGYEAYFILIDASMTTIIIAPFIWLLVGRPLVKAAEDEKLRAKTIFDQVIDAVVTLDSQGRIFSVNPAAERTFGFTLEELAGRSVNLLFTEEPTDINKLFSEGTNRVTDFQSLSFKERNCKSRSGKTLIMDVSLSAIRHHGREEWLLIMHDISQHKDTERALRERDERFRQIFEQADDAIAFFKPDTSSIIDINTTFADLFGYGKKEILTAKVDQLIGPKDVPLVKNAIRQTSRGVASRLDNFTGINRNGRQFNLSMRSKLMTIDNVGIVFCSFRDITSRIRLEKEAKNIQTKLIQTNKMTSLGLMVSGVAHEINNPNNFILANSRLLANTWEDSRKILNEYYLANGDFCLGGILFSELDKQSPQLFSGIVDGSRRINEIVNNLKNFYRPERIMEDCVDISQVVNSSVSLLHHELVKYTQNFQMKLPEKLPSVKGNAQQIGQVVINLLMNACQSLPSKTHGIWMETSYDAQASQITLTVRDEGRGMTPEDSRRVMEPFFTTKLDEGGTGLGLTICRSIIVEHNGTLEFESTPGKGTTFYVRLPANTSVPKD